MTNDECKEWARIFIAIRGGYLSNKLETHEQAMRLIEEIKNIIEMLRYGNPGDGIESTMHKDIKEAQIERELQDGSKYRASISWTYYPKGTENKIIPLFMDVFKEAEDGSHKDFFVNFNPRGKIHTSVICPECTKKDIKTKLDFKELIQKEKKSIFMPTEAFLTVYCPICMKKISELDIRNAMMKEYVFNEPPQGKKGV